MRYFIFNPLVMDQLKAFHVAEDHLEDNCIVYVYDDGYGLGCDVTEIPPGKRPKAFPDTHLVRVEQDGSLRIVDSNFT